MRFREVNITLRLSILIVCSSTLQRAMDISWWRNFSFPIARPWALKTEMIGSRYTALCAGVRSVYYSLPSKPFSQSCFYATLRLNLQFQCSLSLLCSRQLLFPPSVCSAVPPRCVCVCRQLVVVICVAEFYDLFVQLLAIQWTCVLKEISFAAGLNLDVRDSVGFFAVFFLQWNSFVHFSWPSWNCYWRTAQTMKQGQRMEKQHLVRDTGICFEVSLCLHLI